MGFVLLGVAAFAAYADFARAAVDGQSIAIYGDDQLILLDDSFSSRRERSFISRETFAGGFRLPMMPS